MYTFRFLLVALMSLSLLLSACGGQQENHEDMATPAETSEVVYESGAWMGMTLTDARTRAAFKLSDYNGKTVILEMMDPGCPVCSVQVKEVVAALDTLGNIAVAVSVDVGYKGVEAQVYWGDKYGAPWSLAQMTREFGQALMSDFGGKIIYPGDTPVIIIDPSGTAHVTDSGIKKAATLVDLVNQWTQ